MPHKSFIPNFLVTFALATASILTIPTFADDAKAQAIKKEQERFAGSWRLVEIEADGEKQKPKEGELTRVVNGADGTWTLYENGQIVGKGTNTIDPTKTPKTIDLDITEGDLKGQKMLGIYEMTDTTRKLCVEVQNKVRPKDFTAPKGSDRLVLLFEREK